MSGKTKGILTIILLSMCLSRAALADASPENAPTIFDSINQQRLLRGLDALVVDDELNAKAEAWAVSMADAGKISHSSITDGITDNWTKLGENVGSGPTITAVVTGLVASPGHLSNMVDPAFNRVGVGDFTKNGVIYVVQEFETEVAPAPVPTVRTRPPATLPPETTTTTTAPPPSTTTSTTTTTTIPVPPPTTIPPPTRTVVPDQPNTFHRLRSLASDGKRATVCLTETLTFSLQSVLAVQRSHVQSFDPFHQWDCSSLT